MRSDAVQGGTSASAVRKKIEPRVCCGCGSTARQGDGAGCVSVLREQGTWTGRRVRGGLRATTFGLSLCACAHGKQEAQVAVNDTSLCTGTRISGEAS